MKHVVLSGDEGGYTRVESLPLTIHQGIGTINGRAQWGLVTLLQKTDEYGNLINVETSFVYNQRKEEFFLTDYDKKTTDMNQAVKNHEQAINTYMYKETRT